MIQNQTITTYEDIDWHQLWLNARSKKSWQSKGAKEWNKKASSFSQRTWQTTYASQFLQQAQIAPTDTVIDMGCGPGTLAIPLAKIVRCITAIDYSEGMLDQLERFIEEMGINNIKPVQCSWDSDWNEHDIGLHDVAIASRSMNIDNLEEGIRKLDAHARKQVIIADRISPSPFDPDAFEAIGRPFDSGPDYIHTLNTLYTLGIHPLVKHIEMEPEQNFTDLSEALDSYRWMFRDLNSDEDKALSTFLQSRIIARQDERITIRRRFPQRWAMISWIKS